MRRDVRDEILRSFLLFNSALREEVRDVRRLLAARQAEAKYNPNWRLQPRAPRGTAEGGQWTDGGGAIGTKPSQPKNNRVNRPGLGHNRPPPDTLVDIFPNLNNSPASAILAPIDGFLGLTAPGAAANEAATRNLSRDLIREIQAIDPGYTPPSFAEPGGFPNTIEGRNNHLAMLRADRAAALYNMRGETGPLQVETLLFVQARVDAAYTEGVRLYEAGQLDIHLGRNEAIGNYIDATVRQELREFFARIGVSTARGQAVQVNRRAPHISESTYTIPDARVGNVMFDMTLTPKRPGSRQITGFFGSRFSPIAIIIIRPSQLRGEYTYAITPPSTALGD